MDELWGSREKIQDFIFADSNIEKYIIRELIRSLLFNKIIQMEFILQSRFI